MIHKVVNVIHILLYLCRDYKDSKQRQKVRRQKIEMKKVFNVQVEEDVLKHLKIIAAINGTSIAGLLRQQIEKLIEDQPENIKQLLK